MRPGGCGRRGSRAAAPERVNGTNHTPSTVATYAPSRAAVPEHGASISLAARRDPGAGLGCRACRRLRRVHEHVRVDRDRVGASRLTGSGADEPGRSEHPDHPDRGFAAGRAARPAPSDEELRGGRDQSDIPRSGSGEGDRRQAHQRRAKTPPRPDARQQPPQHLVLGPRPADRTGNGRRGPRRARRTRRAGAHRRDERGERALQQGLRGRAVGGARRAAKAR